MTGFGGGSSKMDPRPGDAIRLWRSTKLLRIFVVSGAGVASRHDCSVAASRDEYALYRQQPAQAGQEMADIAGSIEQGLQNGPKTDPWLVRPSKNPLAGRVKERP